MQLLWVLLPVFTLVCRAGMLSPGEQQRLSVARVLRRRPALAVLDEPVNALSPSQGSHLIQQMRADGIAVVVFAQQGSVALRDGDLVVLAGDGSGKWQLEQLGMEHR